MSTTLPLDLVHPERKWAAWADYRWLIYLETDRLRTGRPAGALLAYMVYLYCGRLGITYDHFWGGWSPQLEPRQLMLSTCLLRYPDVFLLCPLAKGRGIR